MKLLIPSLVALLSLSSLAAEPIRLGVMETAFGQRCMVESIALTKDAGFAGVQLHTGKLEKDGTLTISNKDLQKQFLSAAQEHEVEIISLCAGSMNRLVIWKEGKDRENGLSIMKESIEACEALGCKILLYPFFGPSNFQDDDAKLAGVAEFTKEILPIAEEHGVTLGIESPITYQRVNELFARLGNPPNLKMYYDTGNMMRAGEDVYATIKALGEGAICELHLKPEGNIHFGKGKTDLPKLAQALDTVGYDQWMLFEARGGVVNGDPGLAIANREGMERLVKLRKQKAD
ncbi:sugar phosphate isomerase/epimerase family protein [Roseibacillus persicicus]|uniref:sugar phosphate isomerase/epimerase family protein n=1 Tax=Roseibacillus persicicus TaxID=454148 RepID=UPI00398B819E